MSRVFEVLMEAVVLVIAIEAAILAGLLIVGIVFHAT